MPPKYTTMQQTETLQPIGQPIWPGLSDLGTQRYQLENMRSCLVHGQLEHAKQYVQTVKLWIRQAEQNRPDGSAFFAWFIPQHGKKTYTNPRAELIQASLLLIGRLNHEREDSASASAYAYTLLKFTIELYETCIFDQLRRWPRCARAGFDGIWQYKNKLNYLAILRQANEMVLSTQRQEHHGLAARIMRQNAQWCPQNSIEQRMYLHMAAMYLYIEKFANGCPKEKKDTYKYDGKYQSIVCASEQYFGSTVHYRDIGDQWKFEWRRLRENVRVLILNDKSNSSSITRNQLLEMLPKPLDSLKMLKNDIDTAVNEVEETTIVAENIAANEVEETAIVAENTTCTKNEYSLLPQNNNLAQTEQLLNTIPEINGTFPSRSIDNGVLQVAS